MADIIIPVEGMSCGGCSSSVTKALRGLDGVSAVDVTLDPGQASVGYDAGVVGTAAMVKVIEDAGFDVPADWSGRAAAE